MSFMKPRELPQGPRSFNNQARSAKKSGEGGRRGPIEGEYNAFWPREDKALWFAFCPDQSWNFDIWDREEQQVLSKEAQFFYAYTKHYIPKTKRSFYCSATAHKTKPCWGCGIRNHYYEQQREIQDRSGVRPKGEAPLSAMLQYAMSGVLLQKVAKIQAKDAAGKLKVNKDGKAIMKETPLVLLPAAEQKVLEKQGVTTFGLSAHYSFGTNTLSELLAFDDTLKNSCASCAADLTATRAYCPACAEEYTLTEDASALSGQDLAESRTADIRCDCGYFGPLVPIVECACGNPQEGKLVDFAVRLKTTKVSDTSRVLQMTEIKPIGYFVEKYPAVSDLLNSPLDLTKIFAPTSLQFQSMLIPADYKGDGVTPEPRRTKGAVPAAESYAFSGSEDEDE